MTRRHREDTPGSLHHVMNRGIARRTIVENRADARYFESLLAREVRRGEILTHSFSLMTTHFHLLLTSLRGNLAAVMRRITTAYSRWFNRRRKRDGPLFRGRFQSKRVKSDWYRSILHSYIDDNPVAARIVAVASDYPYGSAAAYARGQGPRWLSREWAEQQAMAAGGRDTYRPEDYALRFPTGLDPEIREWVERRIYARDAAEDEFEALLDAPPERVAEWMQRKAQLADGTHALQHLLPPVFVERPIREQRWIPWTVAWNGARRDGWPILHAGLLRDVCGLTYSEIGLRIGADASTARARVLAHRRLLADAAYRLQASVVLAGAGNTAECPLLATHPPQTSAAPYSLYSLSRRR